MTRLSTAAAMAALASVLAVAAPGTAHARAVGGRIACQNDVGQAVREIQRSPDRFTPDQLEFARANLNVAIMQCNFNGNEGISTARRVMRTLDLRGDQTALVRYQPEWPDAWD